MINISLSDEYFLKNLANDRHPKRTPNPNLIQSMKILHENENVTERGLVESRSRPTFYAESDADAVFPFPITRHNFLELDVFI